MKIALQIILLAALVFYLMGIVGERNPKYKIIYIAAAVVMIIAIICTMILI